MRPSGPHHKARATHAPCPTTSRAMSDLLYFLFFVSIIPQVIDLSDINLINYPLVRVDDVFLYPFFIVGHLLDKIPQLVQIVPCPVHVIVWVEFHRVIMVSVSPPQIYIPRFYVNFQTRPAASAASLTEKN